MKKFVLSVFTLVFALCIATAQDNEIKLEQLSNNNKATVSQQSEGDFAQVIQRKSTGNSVEILQTTLGGSIEGRSGFTPTGQRAKIEQVGGQNRFKLESEGQNNRVNALQRGNSNTADIDIINYVSNGSRVELVQNGNSNRAVANMESPSILRADQIGNFNRIDYKADGGANSHEATLLQDGSRNRMNVDQLGEREIINARQLGSDNSLTATQGKLGVDFNPGFNRIKALQQGNGNVANLTQNNN